ncbi:MAG: right-handed parallel beta-helix repeat-containing protein [Phycisphaerae bacterium]|nr:right-handed parallel beta-helix repeat-containing protein [Phycisphaerae bacterium]
MEAHGRIIIGATLCMLLAALPATTSAKTIYVDDDAVGVADGSSWTDAYTQLQKALNAAESGDEICVAQGVYRPDLHSPTTAVRGSSPVSPSVKSFEIAKGVAIRGGFAGFGTDDPNARDVERYETILSGDLCGNDVVGWGLGHPLYESLHADNRGYVIWSSYAIRGGDTVAVPQLDGFVIESATQSALYNVGGSLSVGNCTFRRNTSQETSGPAILCLGGELILSTCVFENNASAISGGAVYVSDAVLTLSDCRFAGNWTPTLGGAIHAVNSDMVLTGCTFAQNAAGQGGAIRHEEGALTLTDCWFETNMADRQGGAVDLTGQGSASMTRCAFRNNRLADYGGAVANGGVPLFLDACAFSGNRATWGGAVYVHGFSSLHAESPTTGTVMTHCLFAGNYASNTGGALWGSLADFTVRGCTFAGNTGGTLTWWASTQIVCRVTMENCIVWDGEDSITASFPPTRGGPRDVMAGVELTITHSDVQGGWTGDGNIDADPCFAEPGHWANAGALSTVVSASYGGAVWVEGHYHLKSQAGRWDSTSEGWVLDEVTSPCIDAGDPNSPVGDEPEPNGGRINLGVYGGTAEASKTF